MLLQLKKNWYPLARLIKEKMRENRIFQNPDWMRGYHHISYIY